MHVVMGASGQVGSAVVKSLVERGEKVRAVVRSREKAAPLEALGAEIAIADAFDREALRAAFEGGETVLVLTPETGKSDDTLGDTKKLVASYRAAADDTKIGTVVALSSIGAHLGRGTGNLEMSFLLEHGFEGSTAAVVVVRPSYYFSNWLHGVERAKNDGILDTFYPVDLPIPMASPDDVAATLAEIMVEHERGPATFELLGPTYTSADVAKEMARVLGRPVTAERIPKSAYDALFAEMGFTKDAAKNFALMADVVSEGRAAPERTGTIVRSLPTTLAEYLDAHVGAKP